MQTDPESPRGQLMSQYVCARITQLNRIDISLFEYDRHNAVYYFILNSDEYIYMRYGGRDETSPEAYLNLESLEIALQLGLEQHEKHGKGLLPPQERPKPMYPSDLALLEEEVVSMGRCVECHLVTDYATQDKEFEGTLDKLTDLFISPDIKTIGIHLDVPKGLVVEKADGAVQEAGMQPGDLVSALNGTPVYTFGDLQHVYDKVPRDATGITLTVTRDEKSRDLSVDLPKEWWFTDLYHRYMTVDPQLFFYVVPLTDDEKKERGLPVDGFASLVVETDAAAKTWALHTLKKGDIIYAVDGVQTDPDTQNLEILIKLSKTAGEDFMISLLRDGKPMDMKIRTYRQSFRKRKL